MTIPANGMEDGWFQDPMEVKPDHRLVTSLAEGQRLATGAPAVVGGWGRLGNVGDGNILMSHGIPTVQYGAGDIRIYKEWPRSEEHTSELQSRLHLVCRLLLEKKKGRHDGDDRLHPVYLPHALNRSRRILVAGAQ